MLICFNSTTEAKKALDALLATKEFNDVSEAVCVALVNYEVMRHVIGKSGGPVPEGSITGVRAKASTASEQTAGEGSDSYQKELHGAAAASEDLSIFGLAAPTLDGIELLKVEGSQDKTAADLPPKDWLFGQLNRFLPAKVTCRALLNLQRENPKGIPVSEAPSRIAFAACRLGDYLRELDRRHGHTRETVLAAAFPSTEYHGAESRIRFGNQFVGSLKQGQLTGLPGGIKLVGHDRGKDPLLLLTEAGGQFALLANPILDGGPNIGQKLSEAETRFLLDHIRKHIPAEVSAYVAIIDGIKTKANTPDKLDKYLRQRFGLEGEGRITSTFLATQRTGAISRMADLGLVSREKKGLNISYVVTHPGECFRNEIR